MVIYSASFGINTSEYSSVVKSLPTNQKVPSSIPYLCHEIFL